jgi:cell division protein YceG involved in septum cleavage
MVLITRRVVLLVLVSLFFGAITNAFAQHPTIKGKILFDFPSGAEPLKNAQVRLISQDTVEVQKCFTDSWGRFVFNDIPQGEYKLEVLFNEKMMTKITPEGTVRFQSVSVSGQTTTKIPPITVSNDQ